MKTITFECYTQNIRDRQARLELAGELPDLESCRNDGARRTPNKRRLLANAEARAKAAGIEPVPSKY